MQNSNEIHWLSPKTKNDGAEDMQILLQNYKIMLGFTKDRKSPEEALFDLIHLRVTVNPEIK